jgi:hypothetical protein
MSSEIHPATLCVVHYTYRQGYAYTLTYVGARASLYIWDDFPNLKVLKERVWGFTYVM